MGTCTLLSSSSPLLCFCPFAALIATQVGNKVGDVERFGDNVENEYDQGRADVDRFDGNVGNAYDQGRDEGRNDNW